MIVCTFDDVKLLQNVMLDYNLVFEFVKNEMGREFVKNEMGRDFVHTCGGTFAYII